MGALLDSIKLLSVYFVKVYLGIFNVLRNEFGFPCGSAGKESTCNTGDLDSFPKLGRSPGDGKGYPLQHAGLENSMDSRVHVVAKSRTQLSDIHFTSLHIMNSYTRVLKSLVTFYCWYYLLLVKMVTVKFLFYKITINIWISYSVSILLVIVVYIEQINSY